MVVGPGIVGSAVAHAGLFGFDFLDIFGDDDKKSAMHHPRPGADGGQAARTVGITTSDAGPPVPTFGSIPESAGRGRDGGGRLPSSSGVGRPSNLPKVSSAPITRNIVIRVAPSEATPDPQVVPPALGQEPSAVPLASPPPSPPIPEGRPTPAAPPAPAPAPRTKNPVTPNISGLPVKLPDSFRPGYAEYLRAATTTDLLVAALPGVAGIMGYTVAGAYAGYRQARALQAALLAPVPTSVLL